MAPQLLKFGVWELVASSVTRACGVATVGRGRVARIGAQPHINPDPAYGRQDPLFCLAQVLTVWIIKEFPCVMACGHKWGLDLSVRSQTEVVEAAAHSPIATPPR